MLISLLQFKWRLWCYLVDWQFSFRISFRLGYTEVKRKVSFGIPWRIVDWIEPTSAETRLLDELSPLTEE